MMEKFNTKDRGGRMETKEKLKEKINESIKKIENMIENNSPSKDIYQEKEKLDKLLSSYLERYY